MSSSNQVARQRSHSGSSLNSRNRKTARDYTLPPTTMPPIARHFDPCAATSGMFLYAQGNSIVCCHHDTLTIERRFSSHREEVQILCVDNASERGAGRLVVSYDAGQNAIVWDIMTGTEVSRFASFTNLTAAAWMRNGAVAFGNTTGTIILFDPETSEHLSFRTIDQIAVTALAPAQDCRTYAIGYQNGSLLICNLQPRFTILHNLTTSRGPSPIVNLAWHASSARQKSDMLAVQTYDGDLRVWSVSKTHNSADPAKPVRILKRTENYTPGPNWMDWSKNGRVIQYTEGETLSWDVRTKHVTFDAIPTQHVKGIAVYGPGATLFTLGPNNTVQQFDLNAPAVKVADVQHPANLLPPSPPISIEERQKIEAAQSSEEEPTPPPASDTASASSAAPTSESEISIHLDGGVSESDEDHMSPFARLGQALTHSPTSDMARAASPASSRSHISSQSSRSGQSSRTPGPMYGNAAGAQSASNLSRAFTESTYMSMGSSIRSSAVGPAKFQPPPTASTQSMSISSYSTGQSSRNAVSRPSRLRNEVARSPDDSRVGDLFKFTRSRLSDVPYRMPPPLGDSRLTNDDLRRQMLSTIFGWTRDMEDLVRDEMSRHTGGSPNRILLARWLGDLDSDIMAAGSESMTSSDWMILALSGIGGQASQQKLGRAYVQRLLESGDLNAAATIMIGMGDYNDAIEIYVSHHKYMEALIVACLFYPSVWERQSHLITKWGEWAIKNGQRQLAIRCFACTGKESTEPWTSPSAIQMNFPSIQETLPEVLSPPLSPPKDIRHGPQRSMANTTLRLITTFSEDNTRRKFYASAEGNGATPIAAGVTPIQLDTALSPPNSGNDVTTAFVVPSQRSAFNTPSSARPSAGGFGRKRLASIGEAPGDAIPRNLIQSEAADLPTPPVERSESTRPASPKVDHTLDNYAIGMSLPRASTSSPLYRRKQQPPPSPSPASLAMLMEGRKSVNGSRNRIPAGIDLQIQSKATPAIDVVSPEQSVTSSNRYRWPSRRRGPGSVSSSVTSASSAANRNHRFRTGEVANVSKTLDEYISSLEAARTRARGRPSSGDRRPRSRESSRHRRAPESTSDAPTPTPSMHMRTNSAVEERGRPTRSYASSRASGKRSPQSPVPMSPEDLINLSTPKMASLEAKSVNPEMVQVVRRASVAGHGHTSRPASRTSSRGRSARPQSPARPAPVVDTGRGRSNTRSGSYARSPVSPQPFSSSGADYFASEDDDDDLQKALNEKERFRNRGKSSKGGHSRVSSQGDQSSDFVTTQKRERSSSRRRPTPAPDVAVAPIIARKERNQSGPPPAPSAITVASGIGNNLVRAKTPAQIADNGGRKSSASNRSTGDLKQLSQDERALRKAQAARELEERRKSLARRPLAPPVIHPDEITPSSMSFVESTTPLETDVAEIASRSQSTETVSKGHFGMFANRSPSVGLPATPKAMRFVMDSHIPSVPSLPPNYSSYHQSPNASGEHSPESSSPKEGVTQGPPGTAETNVVPPLDATIQLNPEPNLTLLPSTVYQPPPFPRSMSAPPEKSFRGRSGSESGTQRLTRGPKLIIPPSSHENVPVEVDNVIDVPPPQNHRSDDDSPPPPMLKELAHLARPPPPPPPPLRVGLPSKPQIYGGYTTGTIEVVMDDGQVKPIITTMSPPPVNPTPGIPPPPPPPPPMPVDMEGSAYNHHRSQSIDSNITGRINRTAERMRSASRGRNNSSGGHGQTPEALYAPYESIPQHGFVRNATSASPEKLGGQSQMQFQNQLPTGLNHHDMI